MKILHVVASYLPATRYGGTIVSVHGLCKALAARGHDVQVFTTSVDGAADSAVPHGAPVDIDGVKVWYFQSRWLRKIYRAPAMARALAERVAAFDVVHTHAIFLWPLWTAGIAAERAGVPHVISPRGMLEKELIERRSPLLKSLQIAFIEKRRLEAAAAIHVTSRREREQAGHFGFNLPPIVEVPNGVDLDAFDDDTASPLRDRLVTKQPFALFLGRVNWKKGLDRLIPALAHAPSASLIIAGGDDEGYRPYVEALARAVGVDQRVTFTGELLEADKRTALDMASVLVLPSYSENFGNVVLESWSHRRPVIVSPEVGLADVVASSGGGWVASTPEEIGNVLQSAMTDRSLRSQAGERGYAEVQARFTWNAVAARMETLYESVTRAS